MTLDELFVQQRRKFGPAAGDNGRQLLLVSFHYSREITSCPYRENIPFVGP